jgi:hypothetical protein
MNDIIRCFEVGFNGGHRLGLVFHQVLGFCGQAQEGNGRDQSVSVRGRFVPG